MTSQDQDVMFKVLVVGNAGVGKTSILKRLVYKSFSDSYKATVGVDFAFYKIQLDDGRQARLMLYDIAGQERYNVLMRSYYKDAYAAFVCGDLQSPTLKEDLSSWKQSIDQKVTFPGTTETIPCYMLCNKGDLSYEYKNSDLEQISQELGFVKWYITSAMTGMNLETCTSDLAKFVIDMIKQKGVVQKPETGISVNPENQQPTTKSGCC